MVIVSHTKNNSMQPLYSLYWQINNTMKHLLLPRFKMTVNVYIFQWQIFIFLNRGISLCYSYFSVLRKWWCSQRHWLRTFISIKDRIILFGYSLKVNLVTLNTLMAWLPHSNLEPIVIGNLVTQKTLTYDFFYFNKVFDSKNERNNH